MPKVIIDCAVCHKKYDEYESAKDVPKVFTCRHCGTGQKTITPQPIGHSRKRNYPEGHWA